MAISGEKGDYAISVYFRGARKWKLTVISHGKFNKDVSVCNKYDEPDEVAQAHHDFSVAVVNVTSLCPLNNLNLSFLALKRRADDDNLFLDGHELGIRGDPDERESNKGEDEGEDDL